MRHDWPAYLLATTAALLLGTFGFVDVRQAQASLTASRAVQAAARGDLDETLPSIEAAVRQNPRDVNYAIQLAGLYASGGMVADRRAARAVLINAWFNAPLNHNLQIQLAVTDAGLIAMGDWSLLDEFSNLMDQMAYQLPNYPLVQGFVGQGYIAAGQYDKAILASDRVISMEGYASPTVRGQAWWVRGAAMEAKGQTEWAREAYQTAIERAPGTYFQERAQADLDRLNGG